MQKEPPSETATDRSEATMNKAPASRYEDIINLPHYEPKHPRMPLESRAAQFAPFAALPLDGISPKGRKNHSDGKRSVER